MKPRKLPSLEYLRECFLYDEHSGKLFWKNRPRKHFASIREWKRWNTRYAGGEAFPETTKHGHKRGRLDGKTLLAHRVVWKVVVGSEPPDVIDHKDRDEANNRWQNLRETTHAQNAVNRGVSGVHSQCGRWRARATLPGGKRVHIGYFGTREEAMAARKAKNLELHGEFSPCD